MILNELIGHVVRSADSGGARIEIVMLPGDQGSVAPRTGFDLDQTSRAEIGPGEFFAPCPDNLDGFAGGFGQAGRFNGRLAGMLAAIAAAHVGLDHAHLGRRQVKRLHEFVANAKRALGSGPNSQLAIGPLGHNGARLKRRVGDVRDGVLLLQLQVRTVIK